LSPKLPTLRPKEVVRILEKAGYYVRNWSLWLDFVIVLKTVRVVWREEGV